MEPLDASAAPAPTSYWEIEPSPEFDTYALLPSGLTAMPVGEAPLPTDPAAPSPPPLATVYSSTVLPPVSVT